MDNKSRFFITHISKILRNLSSDLECDIAIKTNAKNQLNSSLCILCNNICKDIYSFTRTSVKKSITIKEIDNVLSVILDKNLYENSKDYAIIACNNFNNTCSKNLSKQSKAGITFPTTVIDKFLKDFGNRKIIVKKDSSLYIAAIIEYVCYTILTMSCDRAISIDKKRISLSMIIDSIHSNIDICNLYKRYNIVIINTDIASLTLYKNPFIRLIRNTIKNYKTIKLSKNVIDILHHFIEFYTKDILTTANKLVLKSKRVKVTKDDIEFICNVKGIKTRVIEDSIEMLEI